MFQKVIYTLKKKNHLQQTQGIGWTNTLRWTQTLRVGSSVTLDSTPLIAKAQASRQPLETRRQDTASSFGAALAHTKLHATRHIIYIYSSLDPFLQQKRRCTYPASTSSNSGGNLPRVCSTMDWTPKRGPLLSGLNSGTIEWMTVNTRLEGKNTRQVSRTCTKNTANTCKQRKQHMIIIH